MSHIHSAAVLGAGTMGAQIAAHLANAGVPVLLLDLDRATAAEGLRRAQKLKPAPFFTRAGADLISIGSFDDDLPRLRECDWIIEAIVERLDIKRQLTEKLEQVRAPNAIVSSNTSGIPIAFLVYSTDPEAPWAAGREAAWARLEVLLKETRAGAEALGADYGVVSVASVYAIGGAGELEKMIETYPDMRGFGWDLEEPGRRLAELCERNAIPFRGLLAGFRQAAQGSAGPLHWAFDRHWTPAGHDRAAREIAAFIQAQGSEGSPGP